MSASTADHVDAHATPGYVTDPSTGGTMRVEADARSTAR